jgi:hypothetical protein
MKKSTLVLSILFLSLSALAADELTKSDLIGTWETGKETTPQVEVFLADGSYCSYATPAAQHPYSRGTWTLGTSGSIVLDITASEDSSDLSQSDLGQSRHARFGKHGRLLMGIPCESCSGGILGPSYKRADPQRQSCSG